MNIAIDLDDTLVDTMNPLLRFMNKKYHLDLSLHKLKPEKLREQIGITREEEVKSIKEYIQSEYVKETKPLEGAIEAVKNLAKKHKIIVITHRGSNEEKTTRKLLKDYFEDNIKVIHFGRKDISEQVKKKSEICKENQIELIIEDDHFNAIDCYENGIKVILFDYPWNRLPHPEGIIRVKNWQEALKYISS